jgi:GNAT superfamily N-acetyltransferase
MERRSMSPIRVRISPPNDFEQLDVLYRVWGYQGGIAAADIVYVAEEGKRPIGLVRRTLEEGRVLLRGMRVDPAYQRQGVGSRLLDAFVADLSHAECYCIPYRHLTSFYQRGGFAVIDESEAPAFLVQRIQRYREQGLDVLIMRR